MNRRSLLGLLGTTSLSFAGCAEQREEADTPTPTPTPTSEEAETETPAQPADADDLDGYVRPEDDPKPIDELVCKDEEFERHAKVYDSISWGIHRADSHKEFALRVNQLSFKHGNEVKIQLTNLTNEPQGVPNEIYYNLEVYTEAGWQDVRGWVEGLPYGDPFPYSEEINNQQPGDGYEWSFKLTEEDILKDHTFKEELTVCSGLPSGRYRFVFTQGGIAVGFDVH